MKCAKCGAEIQEDTIFCPECGSYIELKRTEEREAEKENREQDSELGGTETNMSEEVDRSESENVGVERDITANLQGSQGLDSNYQQTAQSGTGSGQYFDWKENQAATYSSAGKPKKSKAPYIVMGVVGTAIAVTLIYLVITLTGADKAKSFVEKALQNTFDALAEDERGEMLNEILEGEQISQQVAVTLSELTVSERGMATDLLKDYSPISFSVSVDSDKIEAQAMMALTAMVGDMKPARLEIFADSAGVILGLPGLYDNYLGVNADDIEDLTGREINPEAVTEMESQQESIQSLADTLKEWYSLMYNDINCEKTQTVKLDTGNSIVETDEYVLSMSERNYAKHMKNLPKMIKENKTFMSWYANMSSDREADYFIKNLEEIVEESMVDSWVSEVILCYVRISQNQVIEIRVPLDDGKKQEGELVFSFFGKENLGDDLRIDLQMSVDEESAAAYYRAVKDGEKNNIQLSAEVDGMFSMEMSLEGEYHITDTEYAYEMDNLDIIVATKNYLGESTSVKLGLSGSYMVTEAEEFTVPEYSDTIKVAELGTQEQQKLIIKILDNALERGYVPSAFIEQFSYFVTQIKGQTDPSSGVGDNGGGSLDGSEYLTYEEFVSAVKEIYGDVYSEEVLRQLYDSIYGDGEEPEENTTSSELNRLYCEEGDLILEIKPVEGFEIDLDYSDEYALSYEKDIEDTDQILLDYQITTEKMEENMEYSREFQREFYIDSGFDIEISEVQNGMIGGFKAAWFEYQVSDANGNKASGYNAYVQIDKDHGCVLDMYSLFGSEEVSLDLLMKCFDLYLIEQ